MAPKRQKSTKPALAACSANLEEVPFSPLLRNSWAVRCIKGMTLQLSQGDVIQDPAVRGGKDYWRRAAVFFGLLPSVDTQAPVVARLESGEPGRWLGRAQIVAPTSGEFQKVIGHLGADAMSPYVSGPDATVSVAHKTGQWMQAACLQRFIVNVYRFLICRGKPPLKIQQ
jgi:hypothetical protein